MKIDPYYQRQKCRPKIAVSTEVRFMRIFSGVRWEGASNEGGVSFLAIFDQYVAISRKRCILDTKLAYYRTVIGNHMQASEWRHFR